VPLTAAGRPLDAIPAVQAFYANRGYRAAWFDDGGLRAGAPAVTGLLASAGDDGLLPGDYAYAVLARAMSAYGAGLADPAPVDLELILTDAVLAYASDMLSGRIRPETLYRPWESSPRELDLPRYLQQALDAGRLVPALRELAPQHDEYRRLRGLLGLYRDIRRHGGLVKVPPGETLKPGMRSERVANLRRRLWQTGDLLPVAHPPLGACRTQG
jgi:murein L,D-transpeptidase YcbB/YkuD